MANGIFVAGEFTLAGGNKEVCSGWGKETKFGEICFLVFFYLFFKDSVCPDGWLFFDDVCINITDDSVAYDDTAAACMMGAVYTHQFLGAWLTVSSDGFD